MVIRSGALLSDIILPGHRRVVHELVIADGPSWKDWNFVASPVLGFGSVTEIHPGGPFRFSDKYRTRIYALPRGEAVPGKLTAEWKAGHPSSEPPTAEIATVPVTSSLTHVLTQVTIEEVGPGRLRLGLADETREHAWPPALTWIVTIALVGAGVAGLLRLRRRRRAAAGV